MILPIVGVPIMLCGSLGLSATYFTRNPWLTLVGFVVGFGASIVYLIPLLTVHERMAATSEGSGHSFVDGQCAALYASTIGCGMRPRSESSCPLSFAQARMAAVSGLREGRLRFEEDWREAPEPFEAPIRRPAEMYGSSAAFSSSACSVVRSISYAVPFSEKCTVSPSPTSRTVLSMSSTNWCRIRFAISRQ